MRLSPYFTREEFACKCGCGKDTVDAELLRILNDVRQHFNAKVRINSANRCEEHNKAVGGSPNSQHLTSKAADITVDNVPPEMVADYMEVKANGLGRYDTFTHVDVRDTPASWSSRGKG